MFSHNLTRFPETYKGFPIYEHMTITHFSKSTETSRNGVHKRCHWASSFDPYIGKHRVPSLFRFPTRTEQPEIIASISYTRSVRSTLFFGV